jgi:hypothetical protein
MRSKSIVDTIAFQTAHTPILKDKILAIATVLAMVSPTAGQEAPDKPQREAATTANKADRPQAELEAAFAKMLSGATLEGNFTNTSSDRDPNKLAREKYTLGEVKKLGGNIWLIPARIEYGEHDVTLPITVPIEWAGDTPVIVVDNVGLPGFGTVSARVMFFADHYAGYWKHGRSGGHLFGVIRHEEQAATPSDTDRPVESNANTDSANL